MKKWKAMKTVLTECLRENSDLTVAEARNLAEKIENYIIDTLEESSIQVKKLCVLRKTKRITGVKDSRREYRGYSVKNTGVKHV